MYCRKLRVVWLVGRLVTDCNLVVYFVYYINYVAMYIRVGQYYNIIDYRDIKVSR